MTHDRLWMHEQMRRGGLFPDMTRDQPDSAERKRLEMQAIPFALPERRRPMNSFRDPVLGFVRIVNADGSTHGWRYITDYGAVELDGPPPDDHEALARKIRAWAQSEWDAGRELTRYPAQED